MNEIKKEADSYCTYPATGFSEGGAADVTAWKLARSAIEHENNLINHRLTWFFSSQAFLLTAFFVMVSANSDKSFLQMLTTMHGLWVPFATIGILAIYMCLVTHSGMESAYDAIGRVTQHYGKLKESLHFERVPPLHEWGPPSMIDSRHVPIVTLVMWLLLVTAACVAAPPVAVQNSTSCPTREPAFMVAGAVLLFGGGLAVGYFWGVARRKRVERLLRASASFPPAAAQSPPPARESNSSTP